MTENDQNEALSLPEILKAQLFKGPRQPLRSAYLLFAEALLPLLARYLHRQQIRFKVSAPLNLQKNGPKRVIFICPDLAESKKNLPRFVLTYLQDLPRCRRPRLTITYEPRSSILLSAAANARPWSSTRLRSYQMTAT